MAPCTEGPAAGQGETYTFTDLGGNLCGCQDAAVVCQLMSSDLEPPSPL